MQHDAIVTGVGDRTARANRRDPRAVCRGRDATPAHLETARRIFAAVGAALFFVAGATAAPLWPLCQARVYDLFPGRPGLAAAAGNLFSPLDVVFPIALQVGFVFIGAQAGM